MDLKLSVANITIASNFMTLIVLIILLFGINPSEVLAQRANTTNATNSSPITVVIPTGSEVTTGSGDMSQIQ
jgi:hypothetical protein